MINFKTILKVIVLAQIASDAAKGIYEEKYNLLDESPKLKELWRDADYAKKDSYLARAIKMIDSIPPCGIYYYVVRDGDQNGNMSNVVYFEFKINSNKYQISFHNFRREIKAKATHGRPTHWVGKVGASREATLVAIDYLTQEWS